MPGACPTDASLQSRERSAFGATCRGHRLNADDTLDRIAGIDAAVESPGRVMARSTPLVPDARPGPMPKSHVVFLARTRLPGRPRTRSPRGGATASLAELKTYGFACSEHIGAVFRDSESAGRLYALARANRSKSWRSIAMSPANEIAFCNDCGGWKRITGREPARCRASA